jgi:hypothetical protein
LGFLDDGAKSKLPIFRIISEGIATRKEINETYTFMDIQETIGLIDFKNEVEAAISEISTPKMES